MRLLLLFILLMTDIFWQPLAFAESQKIILATDDWEPYISKTHVGQGKFCDIIGRVFNEMGLEVEYLFAPWRRVEAIVKSGEAFAGVPYSYTPERHKTFDYSTPIMNSVYVFFYKKTAYPNGINYSTLADLSTYHISGVIGYWYEDLFKQADLNVEYVTNDEQGISKLQFNRVDLAASDELVGWQLIHKLYPNDAAQFTVTTPFGTQYLHLLVSKNYPNAAQITEKFNATFKRLKEAGALPNL